MLEQIAEQIQLGHSIDAALSLYLSCAFGLDSPSNSLVLAMPCICYARLHLVPVGQNHLPIVESCWPTFPCYHARLHSLQLIKIIYLALLARPNAIATLPMYCSFAIVATAHCAQSVGQI